MNTETILHTTETDLKQVDHRNITVETDFNKRGLTNYGDIEGLARNIVANGVMEALIGYKVRNEDRFVLTEGHRRLKAITLAFKYNAEGKVGFEDISKIERVPLRTASADKKERLIIMATTGFGKVPLTEMEKAELYSELIEMDVKSGVKRGEAIKALVIRLGISQATVYNLLKLTELPDEIKEAIVKNQISGSTVVTIVREVKDVEEQKRLVNAAIESANTSTETEGKKAKATAKNVAGLKAKSPMQRLKEVAAKLEAQGTQNVRSKVLLELVEALEKKRSLSKIVELFI